MSANGLAPFIKVTDSNGLPIVGAVLKVYQAGTAAYLAIYSDSGLTVPMSNPLQGANASNANGDFPRFYLGPGTYKLRAETSSGALIWEFDNIDSGLSAGVGALPVASGGTGATTAGAARANLGAASTSDVTALSSQIAAFSASLQNLISTPQGRLTPTTLTPVITADVIAGTSVFYTPYIGNLCPVYNGSQFTLQTFAELSLTLNTSYILSTIYDLFVINDSVNGVTLVSGPAWTSIVLGSGSRGTGAGTTELTRLNGLLVNANAMATARNGATTYSVAANQGTYVGSIYIDATAGQVTCHVSYGQTRKFGIWNAYNRSVINLKEGDPSGSWSYTTGTIRPANGASNNFLDIFCGLPEESANLEYSILASASLGASATMAPRVYIGYNSITAGTGRLGGFSNAADGGNSTTLPTAGICSARYTTLPTLGANRVTALENGQGASSTTWNGTETNMLLSAMWRG